MFKAIRKAIVSLLIPDDSAYPRVQVSYNGVVTDAYRMSLYGMSSQPPLDSLAMVLSADGRMDDPIAMISNPRGRFDELIEGEVEVGNEVTRTSIKFASNSDMVMTVANNGDMVMDITGGGVRVTSNGNVDVTAPQVTMTANLVVTGNVTVSGNATVAGIVNGQTNVIGGPAGTSLIAHVHAISGGSSAPGPTAPPT